MDMTNRFRALTVICVAVALAAAGVHGAAAQDWSWDGGDSDSRAPGRGGPYDAPPYGQSRVYGQPGYGQQPGASQPDSGGSAPLGGSVSPRCRELELQLTGGAQPASKDQIPRIDADMRQADADFRKAQREADRSNCYDDMFLFGRSLKRTPRCIELDGQVQEAKARLAQLKAQRDAIVRGTSPRARHDDLIADLARNRCGEQYTREHKSLSSRLSSIFSFFSSDEDPEGGWHASQSSWFGNSSSLYRTLCVRQCDGFYFPVSTATTESTFAQDEAKCHTQCAAPSELFYHRMDQDVEHMVSLKGVPYTQLPNAFRNRKVYIRGCSCNASEYSADEIAKAEDALKNTKRADASAGVKPLAGSDSDFARRISQAVQNAPAQPPGQPAPAQSGPGKQQAPAAPPPSADSSWKPGVEQPKPPAAKPEQ
jgi:Protein of unknown function (DUF2865)